MTAPKLNWGIMTTGSIARTFATDLANSRSGHLVAVGSRNSVTASSFAQDFGGVRAHGSYEALLADPGVNVVYVATPHPLHSAWAIRSAEAGKHILCEKPLALNRAEAERMIAAAQRHRVFLMEAFMYRCHPQTAALVALIRDGAIGELRLIRATFSLRMNYDPEHRMFKRESGGGAILDLGSYPVSFARMIAGAASGRAFAEPVEFRASGRLHPEARSDEYAAAVAKFPGDVVAELSCGSTVVNDISAQIYGTKGRITIPMPFFPGLGGRDERIFLHRAETIAPEKITFPGGGIPLYAREADAVGDAIARDELESAAMSHADTLGNMAVLDDWRAQVGVTYPGE
jgi:predicted dehydrogenase